MVAISVQAPHVCVCVHVHVHMRVQRQAGAHRQAIPVVNQRRRHSALRHKKSVPSLPLPPFASLSLKSPHSNTIHSHTNTLSGTCFIMHMATDTTSASHLADNQVAATRLIIYSHIQPCTEQMLMVHCINAWSHQCTMAASRPFPRRQKRCGQDASQLNLHANCAILQKQCNQGGGCCECVAGASSKGIQST